MNGTIEIIISDSWQPAVGDEITLFQDVTTFAGTPVLASKVINAEAGLFWDDSELATKGVLRVTNQVPDAIRDVNAQSLDEFNGPVFDLSGRQVARNYQRARRSLKPGVYVVAGQKVTVK